MASPVPRRLTAAGAVYTSAALGIAGTIVAFRLLGPTAAGRFSLVIGVVAFVSLLIELTGDEALVKYGFRYAARGDWARFHHVVRLTFAFELGSGVLAGVLIALFAPFASSVFNDTAGLTGPLLLAALLPLLQAIESMGAQLLILRGRYDVRSILLVYSMGLRLVGLAVGARHGVTAAVLGLLAAQVVTTASISVIGISALRRFPSVSPAPLDDDRRPFFRFVLQSSVDTTIDSLRVWVAPLALGVVRSATEVGLFRAAQAPQQAFAVFSAPLRLILLTEQTRDWEHGRPETVIATLRRYVIGATLLMAVVLPPALLLMPWLIRKLLGEDFAPAGTAAQLVLAASAIQLVFGWTKSFPVTIGRPGLRVVAHAVEAIVLLPLIVAFGSLWGVTGAGLAVLLSAVAYGLTWVVIVLRLRTAHRAARARGSAGYFA